MLLHGVLTARLLDIHHRLVAEAVIMSHMHLLSAPLTWTLSPYSDDDPFT